MVARWISAFLTALALVPAGLAQVQITCQIDPTRVLPLEPLVATVRIENQSAFPIEVGEGDGGATFAFMVESTPGRAVNLIRDPDQPSFTVPARGRFEATYFLHDTYDVRQPRPYTVQARLIWRNQVFTSPRINLEVVPGLEIAKVSAVILGDEPEVSARRTYALRTLSRNQQEVLIARVDDPDRHLCYGVINLGRLVRSTPPVIRVDGEGRAHVLHRSSPYGYAYHVLGPNGRVVSQEGVATEGEAVSLAEDGQGQIIIERGARATPPRPPTSLR